MLKLNMYFGFLLQLAICSFLGMEGELPHIQGFLRLSDIVMIPGLFLIFLHGCEIKSGSGLGTRPARLPVAASQLRSQ